MHRGHQERLAPMLGEAMAAAGAGFADLDRIGVTVGPGSFTGLRVGLAFAKGLAIARGIPCVGVGVLEALAASTGERGQVLAAIDARREQLYLQMFEGGRASGPPSAVLIVELAALKPSQHLTIVGSGARILAEAAPDARILPLAAPDPVAIARLAAQAAVPEAPPSPIYLRAPDARLPS
jgi:tRNA threonylcarbamoyladenosine biosynthesis protein TsaB